MIRDNETYEQYARRKQTEVLEVHGVRGMEAQSIRKFTEYMNSQILLDQSKKEN